MILRKKLGTKGQLVLPKSVRNFLGVKNGSNIIIELTETEVKIRADFESQDFLTHLYSNPKKLKQPIEVNSELDKQYESHNISL